ncbi:hypothetical protein [Methylobacterium sp. J-090]|uniref:hypothetical protein n=1 Tax=Methylobacterium sp. J-090 TaxID=2836666 RepID=UPI001FBB6BC5|nr:hypothetical protein [Methylobacterium sp. J-090]MCJ2079832.1 hypothetical protein [Methylobacterium sp. J-090]
MSKNEFYQSQMLQSVGLPAMGRFQLRTLRRPLNGQGPIETQHAWVEATSAEQAIAQGSFLSEAALEGWSGVSTLTNETGAMIWSVRKDMPRLDGPGSI